MLQNECLLRIISFDTAENEPSEILQVRQKLANFRKKNEHFRSGRTVFRTPRTPGTRRGPALRPGTFQHTRGKRDLKTACIDRPDNWPSDRRQKGKDYNLIQAALCNLNHATTPYIGGLYTFVLRIRTRAQVSKSSTDLISMLTQESSKSDLRYIYVAYPNRRLMHQRRFRARFIS